MTDGLGIWAVFSSGFLASTLLPGGSEVVLAAAVTQTTAAIPPLWLAATVGNSLGGLTSWGIGWWLARRFPAKVPRKPEQRRALERIGRHGSPILLLSWLPWIGDPLCLAAGWAGVGLLPAVLFITIGKGLRYAALVAMLAP